MSNQYVLEDKRTGCLSSIYTTTVEEYLSLVMDVYGDRGGIDGQRAPLKTKTGIRIRTRMVADIVAGAILPPLVIGAVVSDEQFQLAKLLNDNADMKAFLHTLNKDGLSIIDGMQRTTAILDANKDGAINKNPLRIEVWISSNVHELIYRMLVLNTGQVPWDMKRQLETIYKPILTEIQKKVPNIQILLLDENERRSDHGQYLSGRLIEYFLTFTSRKMNIDIKERVAEDFARMDATEATSNDLFLQHFIVSLKNMSDLDAAFSRFTTPSEKSGDRFKIGRDIFSSSPAGLGFIAAASVYIYGPPGFNYKDEEATEKVKELSDRVQNLSNRLNRMSVEALEQFLELSYLNEKLKRKSGKVGEFEREFFFKAFSALLLHANDLPSMEPCWAAY